MWTVYGKKKKRQNKTSRLYILLVPHLIVREPSFNLIFFFISLTCACSNRPARSDPIKSFRGSRQHVEGEQQLWFLAGILDDQSRARVLVQPLAFAGEQHQKSISQRARV